MTKRIAILALLLMLPFRAHAIIITADESTLDFGDVVVGEFAVLIGTFTVTCETGDGLCGYDGMTPSADFSTERQFLGGISSIPEIAEGTTGKWSFAFTFVPLAVGDFQTSTPWSVTGRKTGFGQARASFNMVGSGVTAQVPESSTIGLMALGLIGLAIARRRTRVS